MCVFTFPRRALSMLRVASSKSSRQAPVRAETPRSHIDIGASGEAIVRRFERSNWPTVYFS